MQVPNQSVARRVALQRRKDEKGRMCMRKLSFIVLVLVAFAATPALASVTLSGTTSGTTYTINYSISGPNSARAFALDITVNNSKTISSLACSSSSYYVYPGSIVISGGTATGWGSCVCDLSKFPGKGQGGTGTAGITVEMGSLYGSGASQGHGQGNKPANSGTLVSFVVSGTPTTAHVTANPARGGVVMENPDESSNANVLDLFPAAIDCLKSTATEYGAWCSFNKPNCWCYKRQCRGDATGTKGGSFWVELSDLNILRTGWNKTETQLKGLPATAICADYNHAKGGSFRVELSDLNILRTAWNKTETAVKCCNTNLDCTLTDGDKWNNWTN